MASTFMTEPPESPKPQRAGNESDRTDSNMETAGALLSVDEEEASLHRQNWLATSIQAAWRGYRVRSGLAEGKRPSKEEDLSWSDDDGAARRATVQRQQAAQQRLLRQRSEAATLEEKARYQLESNDTLGPLVGRKKQNYTPTPEPGIWTRPPEDEEAALRRQKKLQEVRNRKAAQRHREGTQREMLENYVASKEEEGVNRGKMSLEQVEELLRAERARQQKQALKEEDFIQKKLQQLRHSEQDRASPMGDGRKSKGRAAGSAVSAARGNNSSLGKSADILPKSSTFARPNSAAQERGLLMTAAKHSCRVAEQDCNYWKNRVSMLKHAMEKAVVKIETAKRQNNLQDISIAMNEQLQRELELQQAETEAALEEKKRVIQSDKAQNRSKLKASLRNRLEKNREICEAAKQEEENNYRMVEQLRYEEVTANISKRHKVQEQKILGTMKRVKSRAEKEEGTHKGYEERLKATLELEQERQRESVDLIRESAVMMRHLEQLKGHQAELRGKYEHPLLRR